MCVSLITGGDKAGSVPVTCHCLLCLSIDGITLPWHPRAAICLLSCNHSWRINQLKKTKQWAGFISVNVNVCKACRMALNCVGQSVCRPTQFLGRIRWINWGFVALCCWFVCLSRLFVSNILSFLCMFKFISHFAADLPVNTWLWSDYYVSSAM